MGQKHKTMQYFKHTKYQYTRNYDYYLKSIQQQTETALDMLMWIHLSTGLPMLLHSEFTGRSYGTLVSMTRLDEEFNLWQGSQKSLLSSPH